MRVRVHACIHARTHDDAAWIQQQKVSGLERQVSWTRAQPLTLYIHDSLPGDSEVACRP